MPSNNSAGEKDVHLPFTEGQPLHQVPPYAWKHWLGLVAGLPLLCLPVGCCCMANQVVGGNRPPLGMLATPRYTLGTYHWRLCRLGLLGLPGAGWSTTSSSLQVASATTALTVSSTKDSTM